jgi:hypothetical protein
VTLQQEANYLLSQALSPGTARLYNTAWRHFTSFATLQGAPISQQGRSSHAREGLMVLFATYCFSVLKCSYSTVKVYLAGVKHHYVSKYGFDPFVHDNGTPFLQLHLIMTGIRKTNSKPTPSRLPITIPILSLLTDTLRRGFHGEYLDSMMTAVLTLAFFGFLRCGEFTSPTVTFNPSTGLALRDISLRSDPNGPFISLFLRASKCDRFREGVTIKVFATGNALCPYAAMQSYLTKRRSISCDPLSPLFCIPPCVPLTRHAFIALLDSLLVNRNLPVHQIRPHSFRIGAATEAARVGIPDHLIKALGRWSSSCYMTYIRTPDDQVKQACLQLSLG